MAPAANTRELSRLDGLIAADMAKAKELEGLCDLIAQIRQEHQGDPTLQARLISEALETESNGDVRN